MDRADILARARHVMARIFNVAPSSIGETTSPSDIAAWDSLSHLVMLTGLEKAFDVDLPLEKAYAARTVADLVGIIGDAEDADVD